MSDVFLFKLGSKNEVLGEWDTCKDVTLLNKQLKNYKDTVSYTISQKSLKVINRIEFLPITKNSVTIIDDVQVKRVIQDHKPISYEKTAILGLHGYLGIFNNHYGELETEVQLFNSNDNKSKCCALDCNLTSDRIVISVFNERNLPFFYFYEIDEIGCLQLLSTYDFNNYVISRRKGSEIYAINYGINIGGRDLITSATFRNDYLVFVGVLDDNGVYSPLFHTQGKTTQLVHLMSNGRDTVIGAGNQTKIIQIEFGIEI